MHLVHLSVLNDLAPKFRTGWIRGRHARRPQDHQFLKPENERTLQRPSDSIWGPCPTAPITFARVQTAAFRLEPGRIVDPAPLNPLKQISPPETQCLWQPSEHRVSRGGSFNSLVGPRDTDAPREDEPARAGQPAGGKLGVEPDFKPGVRALARGRAVSEQKLVLGSFKNEARTRVVRYSFGIRKPERDDIAGSNKISCNVRHD
tara:strand:+ start:5871 stop:6482 length:612 start_codon:yes stop_codon:yes gene_type:complete